MPPQLDDESPTGPSRSQRRRDALAVLNLAAQLVALSPARLARIALPDEVREAIAQTQRIRAQVARKRQLQYLAKLLRRLDDDALAPIRAVLGDDADAHRRSVAAEHRLEQLRAALLHDDDALGALLARHPDADHQQLRALVRQARREQAQGAPAHAARALLRLLRTLEAADAAAASSDTAAP